MKTKLINLGERLRSTYWFLPALMVGLAVGFSFVTIALDQFVQEKRPDLLIWVYAGGPQGVDSLLSTIASSMIAIAGVTFSITIVALSLASSQFGPRLLSNFMRDRGNQIVLGTFIATFIYSLLVLRVLRGDEGNVFVPHISATFAVLLAITNLGVLIYFIHHVSASIQAENIIASVGRDLDEAITRLFPKKRGYGILELEHELRHGDDIPEDFDQEARPIAATQSGYLQAIDYDGLMRIATEKDLLFHLKYRPGDFIVRGSDLVMVWPGKDLDEQLSEKINDAFILGTQRLRMQDVEFTVNQLVEIAVRALSPGINDPFTAIACIDQLGASLVNLAERSIPSAYHYDADNKLCLVTDAVTFGGITDAAFNQIRQYGRSSVAVTIRLLETIAILAAHTSNRERHAALLHQAEMIKRGADEALPEESDRKDVKKRYELVASLLEQQVLGL